MDDGHVSVIKISLYRYDNKEFKKKGINPQISQISQIKLIAVCRIRNLPGLIPRSLLR